MVKDFISDQDGLYKDPFNAAIIKGDKTNTSLVAKYVNDPFFVLDAYGNAQLVPPNTPDINIPGNTAAEIPYNTNKMNYQDGGAASQQQQIVQQVAQMLQQGADPQQVMQQLVQMGIPSKDAENLVSAVIQEIQTAMAQQQGMQDEEMGGQDDMPMAMAGGKACIDCEEQFPQAQNLNWFYKAEGGEAFPAQTYLPYDRGNEPVPNFMFEYGGETDIDRAYRLMKAGGFDMDPRKKKGGKFTGESFQEYVMRNGGDLPMHQWFMSQVGQTPGTYKTLGQPAAPRQAPYTYSPQVANVTNPFARIPAQPNQQRAQPATGFNINRQQSFADQYPGAMQIIMDNTIAPGATQTPAAARAQAATSRAAGSASGVRRAPAAKSAAAPAASGPAISSIQPIYSDRDLDEAPPGTETSANYDDVDEVMAEDFVPSETTTDDGSIPPGLTRKEQRKMARDFRRERRGDSYFNPQAAYYAGQGSAKMFGDKGAAGLSLLSSIIPGFGSAVSTAGPMGGFLGRRDKFKGKIIGPYGSYEGKLKGRESIANMFNSLYNLPQEEDNPPQKEVGGNSNWKYSSYNVPAGIQNAAGALAFQSGALDAIQAAKQKKAQENMLMSQDTISSGIMGPIAAADKAMGPSGTINMPGAINPYLTSQPGNFGFNQFQPSMLQNQMVKFGGNILDQFEDGGVYDLDGMSDEDVREFVNAIYAAGGSVDFL